MASLPFCLPYDRIKRGKVYLVGFPFDDGRPLTFVEPDGENFTLITKDYGFEPLKDEATGREYSPDVSVVVKHKAKLAVVLQNNDLNSNPNWNHTIIAPLDSIKRDDYQTEFIKRAINQNDLDIVHYTNSTGRDALIQITKIKRAHKNLVFRETKYTIAESDIEIVLTKLASLLSITKIPACAECEMNCDKCELKKASSQ